MFSGSIPCANFWPYHIDRKSRSSVESFCVVIEVKAGKREEGRKRGRGSGRIKWNKEGDREGYKGIREEV